MTGGQQHRRGQRPTQSNSNKPLEAPHRRAQAHRPLCQPPTPDQSITLQHPQLPSLPSSPPSSLPPSPYARRTSACAAGSEQKKTRHHTTKFKKNAGLKWIMPYPRIGHGKIHARQKQSNGIPRWEPVSSTNVYRTRAISSSKNLGHTSLKHHCAL